MSTSPISTASPTGNTPSTTSNTNNTATDYQSMFMQLLSTELQSQDPTQTMDPTTMVTQMVQINQLSDVAGIYSILQGASGLSTSGATGAADSQSPSATGNVIHASGVPSGPVSSSPNHTTPNTMGGN